MDSSNLEHLFLQLHFFVEGATDLQALRRWFLPLHTAPISFPSDDDEARHAAIVAAHSPADFESALFWELVWLFEEDLPQGRHHDLARRVEACYTELGDAAAVLELLPLIRARDRFCSIAAKQRSGVVTRVGLVSVVGKTFRSNGAVRDWLSTASADDIEKLCRLLHDDEYAAVITHLSLPPV